MKLSVIITSYKNPDLLKVCLESVKKDLSGIDAEIIVADSETDERTEMMMREDFPGVVFFAFKKNVGFQALLKKGIGSSKGDHLLLLNSDIIVNKGSIKKLLEYQTHNPSVGIVGPKLLNFNGTPQPSCFRFYKPITILYRRTFFGNFGFAKKHLQWFLMEDMDRNKVLDVDWLMGSALMVSRKALEGVGYMDERFFMYMEDVDWCRRFWEKGYKVVYYPDSIMHHYHGKYSGRKGLLHSVFLNKYTWIHIASAYKYFKKYRGKKNPRNN